MADPLKLFGVQLRRIGLAEVSLRSEVFGLPGVSPFEDVNLTTTVTGYDEQNRVLLVFVTAKAAPKDPNLPISLRISVVGEFHVPDPANLPFPQEKLSIWARQNGAAVLLPFLRQQVFDLSQRTGFAPVLIPLLEVKPFKVDAPHAVFSTTSAGPDPQALADAALSTAPGLAQPKV